MSAPILREARQDEFAAIGDLLTAAYREYAARMEPGGWDRMARNLATAPTNIPGAINVVAEIDGALSAFVTYIPPGFSDGVRFPKDWASIRLLGVAPTARGRGLARALAEECLRRARADGAATIGLHTSEAMVTARAMYERMGFVVVRELEPIYGLRYWAFRRELA